MKLNRERIAAGLSLLILAFGLNGLLGARRGASAPDISREIREHGQEIPRIEPRLYNPEKLGGRNPFLIASDWAANTPEDLPAPPVEPTRWFMLPLGLGPDPLDGGITYLEAPPLEVKSQDEESPKERAPDSGAEEAQKKEKEAADAPGGSGKASGAAPEKKSTPPAGNESRSQGGGGRRAP